jgi:hypothetical protein
MADTFCTQHNFDDKRDLFRRAAVIAQNPDDYKTLPELTDDDRYWMEREHTRESSRASERYNGTGDQG